jgi:hypothetical protein
MLLLFFWISYFYNEQKKFEVITINKHFKIEYEEKNTEKIDCEAPEWP